MSEQTPRDAPHSIVRPSSPSSERVSPNPNKRFQDWTIPNRVDSSDHENSPLSW
jgi:hypothetical protein